MSKLGKKTINIPAGVEIKIDGLNVSVKGPKGTLTGTVHNSLAVSVEGSELAVKPAGGKPDRITRAMWGLHWSLLRNMVAGVSAGFNKVLEFQGVGYKAVLKGKDLELGLGFSHPVVIEAPEGITFKTDKSSITIEGIDKELIGRVAAQIRKLRKPEPYKGSGIRYAGEVIKRKAGKKAAAA